MCTLSLVWTNCNCFIIVRQLPHLPSEGSLLHLAEKLWFLLWFLDWALTDAGLTKTQTSVLKPSSMGFQLEHPPADLMVQTSPDGSVQS